jgi:hypothetical protein
MDAYFSAEANGAHKAVEARTARKAKALMAAAPALSFIVVVLRKVNPKPPEVYDRVVQIH